MQIKPTAWAGDLALNFFLGGGLGDAPPPQKKWGNKLQAKICIWYLVHLAWMSVY